MARFHFSDFCLYWDTMGRKRKAIEKGPGVIRNYKDEFDKINVLLNKGFYHYAVYFITCGAAFKNINIPALMEALNNKPLLTYAKEKIRNGDIRAMNQCLKPLRRKYMILSGEENND